MRAAQLCEAGARGVVAIPLRKPEWLRADSGWRGGDMGHLAARPIAGDDSTPVAGVLIILRIGVMLRTVVQPWPRSGVIGNPLGCMAARDARGAEALRTFGRGCALLRGGDGATPLMYVNHATRSVSDSATRRGTMAAAPSGTAMSKQWPCCLSWATATAVVPGGRGKVLPESISSRDCPITSTRSVSCGPPTMWIQLRGQARPSSVGGFTVAGRAGGGGGYCGQ